MHACTNCDANNMHDRSRDTLTASLDATSVISIAVSAAPCHLVAKHFLRRTSVCGPQIVYLNTDINHLISE
jgi:hypothetical protein